jgi:hypothetical protein
MARITEGHHSTVLETPEACQDLILRQVSADDGKYLTGVEWERIPYRYDGSPTSIEDIDRLFKGIRNTYEKATRRQVQVGTINVQGEEHINVLDIPNIGVMTTEAGLQVEFASVPHDLGTKSGEQRFIADMHTFDQILRDNAAQVGLGIYSGAFRQENVNNVPPDGGRGSVLEQYKMLRFGPKTGDAILKAARCTTSLQVTVGLGGKKAYEVAQALLLADLFLALQHSKSPRNHEGWYGQQFGTEFIRPLPVMGIKSNKQLAKAIWERWKDLPVPTLPKRDGSGWSVFFNTNTGATPSIQDMVERGRLTSDDLRYAVKMHTSPAAARGVTPPFKNAPFGKRLMELRMGDSPDTPQACIDRARRVDRLAHNEDVRESVLEAFPLSNGDVSLIFTALSTLPPAKARKLVVEGKPVMDMVDEFLDLTDPASTSVRPMSRPAPNPWYRPRYC